MSEKTETKKSTRGGKRPNQTGPKLKGTGKRVAFNCRLDPVTSSIIESVMIEKKIGKGEAVDAITQQWKTLQHPEFQP